MFHYGIELEGLKFNCEELGALRRRLGIRAKVELTFDPGDLGHINVLDPEKGAYVVFPLWIRSTPRDSLFGSTRSSVATPSDS